MYRIFSFLTILLFCPLALIAQRQIITMDRGWQFSPGWEVRPGVTSEVNLPHMWNYDALSGRADYFRGVGSYVKTIEAPTSWKESRVFLRFKGAATIADLYVNGKHVGQHRGAYSAFAWDITPYITMGQRNNIWVRVNNAPNSDVMPLVGDFNIYGGLYRGVDLIVTPQTHLSLEDHASSGVYITTTRVSQERAEFTVSTTIDGLVGDVSEVRFVLRDANAQQIETTARRVKIGDNGTTDIAAIFTIDNPRLWHSIEDPYLYRVDVIVDAMIMRGESVAGNNNTKGVPLMDSISEYFGLRYFSVDSKDNSFSLNGKPFQIRGVVRMHDWGNLGSALFPANHRRDVEMMQEMGVNAVRVAYGATDPYFLSLCDRAGIIVWSELPLVGPGFNRDKGFNDSEAFRINGKAQLQDMIKQLYNHPSIIFWGLFNELVQRGDDPLAYVRELNTIAKDEDPSRLTVAASNQDGELNFVTDLIGFNQFMGWYSGLPTDFLSWGIQLRRDWPKLAAGISGYGAGASPYQHEDSVRKPVVASHWHPEEWQTYCHEVYWKQIASKKFFWGTFVWAMFDYGTAYRDEGVRPGVTDMGLVSFDRDVKKDAFYFYKANWNSSNYFVHITQRRWEVREKSHQTIKIFSNRPEVELFVNGSSQGSQRNDGYGTFRWRGVKFNEGKNTVEAVTQEGESDKIEIEILR